METQNNITSPSKQKEQMKSQNSKELQKNTLIKSGNCTAFIRGLPLKWGDIEFSKYFKKYHPIIGQVVKRKRGNSRGFGFMEFPDTETRDLAIKEMNGQEVEGKILQVEVESEETKKELKKKKEEEMKLKKEKDVEKAKRAKEYIEIRHLSKCAKLEVAQKQKKCIFVKGFPNTWKIKDLKERFDDFGAIKATILMEKKGISKGCGFVDFENEENAKKAVEEMNGRGVEGGELEVSMAKISERGQKAMTKKVKKQLEKEEKEKLKALKKCIICGEIGHTSKDCPQNENKGSDCCFICGETGHISKDCPNAERKCFVCGKTGHKSRDCPKAKGNNRPCFICGEIGHLDRDCPNKNEKKEKKGGIKRKTKEQKQDPKHIKFEDINDEEESEE
ncbi:hypothetical protein ENUP19_0149G0023 [Entamoeba nuttalli]|uniref:Zinc finger protein, putative n=2 Tax=Entamoeba nuttalli TaxID=412467 RepID=K2HI27_ENTNP|nr:zinc finger protein, putative [Entamoeba nuttalli P19]EKE42624.1 zinc finger protein, putative [Entamoeba nuttalli P19]|eukprot:XP_008855040.1 zinc finger protein, putative [Entamoeba nuttalli P19]